MKLFPGVGVLAFVLAALPLAALAQQGDNENGRENRDANIVNCANGQTRSCITGTITRIDGTTVYVSSSNGQIRVNDQALWDNNRQDMRLATGQTVTFAGYFANDGSFVASSIAYNGAQSYNVNNRGSSVTGRIMRIDGKNVYLNSVNGSIRVKDQALWENNRQDRQLVVGQSVTFGGYFTKQGTFVATSIGANGMQSSNGTTRGFYGCANGQTQSCISGQITRIEGTNVYVNSTNGEIRVNDQALWDNNRQDMQLVTGQTVTLGGYYAPNGVFVATRIVENS